MAANISSNYPSINLSSHNLQVNSRRQQIQALTNQVNEK